MHLDHNHLNERIADVWDKAQSHWSRYLQLSKPIDQSEQESVARIHLHTRQIEINQSQVLQYDLMDCLEAIVAHEIGHHVRYPGTLAVHARLHLMEKSLIPIEDYSVINLFTDLLINEHLGRRGLAKPLIKTYQAFSAGQKWKQDPAFLFYLAIYEELWRCDPGTLMGDILEDYEKAFPQYRADAQLLAQNLFPLGPNLFTQFIYFVSVVCRYLQPKDREKPLSIAPYSCRGDEPTPEDWADALTPSSREKDAIKKALERGWISSRQCERLTGEDSLQERIFSLPGHQDADASQIPEIMAAYYRQQAERYLFRPPPQRILGEATVPTTIEEWEPGDPVNEIDWLTTLSQQGEVLGTAQPLRRSRIADVEGYDVPLWQPRIEIYLDVSGSMPDPRLTYNAMTLASQILMMAAIRAGGWVRAFLYSHSTVGYWKWCRSEIEISRFLMHYVGGGTAYPFDILKDSIEKCGDQQPIRVVISDRDFDMNYGEKPENAQIVADAIDRSPHFILLLHNPNDGYVQEYQKVGAKVIVIDDMEAYPKMAAELSRTLFEDKPHGNN